MLLNLVVLLSDSLVVFPIMLLKSNLEQVELMGRVVVWYTLVRVGSGCSLLESFMVGLVVSFMGTFVVFLLGMDKLGMERFIF